MKNVKPRKAKLVGFAEEMSAGAVPVDQNTAALIESASDGGRTAGGSAQVESIRRSRPPAGVFVLCLILLFLVVAGPPLFVMMSALAYPAVFLLAALAIWKIVDLFRSGD